HEHHHHHHSSMHHIFEDIDALDFSDTVKRNAKAVYERIAQAESKVHGVPVTDIHFHEVGTRDAIADVTAVCVLLEMLGVQKIIASPIRVGFGQVTCAHGILPVPAPATAHLLQGIPFYAGDFQGELCTPTGAALLKYFASSFEPMPMMTVEKIGYGMGKKDFPAANCVRAMLGETQEKDEELLEIKCNIDDMTAEHIAFATEILLENGAKDVYTVPVGMKKNRTGTLLVVLCEKDREQEMVRLLFRHTATLGVRMNTVRRFTMNRTMKTIKTPLGDVRVKCADGFGTTKEKYEYDDLAKIASENQLSLREVLSKLKKGND
ncbi:MAG TPA: nickel pincer cofactor biosynthesis protein LarC, partial [Ruminococcaceae bacterium]|nr:nickel pincer cofactor biosynthesis protein LarC [Oscillospiraceae bacterium]